MSNQPMLKKTSGLGNRIYELGGHRLSVARSGLSSS